MTNLQKFDAHLIKARKEPATRRSYLQWAATYGRWCKEHAQNLTAQEAVCGFLSHLAETKKSGTTQTHALNALAGKNGLYAALGKPLGKLPGWVKAPKSTFLPVWVTQHETTSICSHLTETWSIMASLMFGSGLRVGEVTSLRWRDLDFERLTITVKQGKGRKDRVTFLPRSLVDSLRLRERQCRALWAEDRQRNRPGVATPQSITNKSPQAGKDWPFFWVFPSAKESIAPTTGIQRRHHIHKKSLGKALRTATRRAGIAKRVTAHSFRHGFATAYLMAGGNIRELQDLLGHQSIQTTEVYLHCIPTFSDRVGSPLDHTPDVIPFAPVATPPTIPRTRHA